ncbi:P2Y purinoceptor 8-like [Esox lucius]|uniref:G-protein coupled receptors family 1 profile domain-containing protein n=1 Tax=Esox lucius TaxID=8010 RepID=A0A3P8ZF44_ESOLU|nr:P2Y purinoceptor 8-like [Esox lucius]
MMNATNLSNSTLEMLVSPVMTMAVPAIYLVVFVCSTPFNLVSLVALVSLHSKRPNSTSVLTINLSLADLLYSAFLPLQVLYHLRGNNWPWGSALCGLTTAALYCNMHCSVLISCAIAFERYCGVVHPLRTKHWHTTRRASITCLLIWAFVLVMQYPLFRWDLTLQVTELDITTCFDVLPRRIFENSRNAYLYFIFVMMMFNVLPLAMLVGCYVAVARELRRSSPLETDCSEMKREMSLRRQAQTTVALATLCFVVCYLPTAILHTLHLVFHAQGYGRLYMYYELALSINSFNCCFDPFLYYFASREFRWALRKRFGWCCPLINESGNTALVSKTG